MTAADSTRFTLNLEAIREELQLLATAIDASLEDRQLADPEQARTLREVILEGEELLDKLRNIHARSVTYNRGQRI